MFQNFITQLQQNLTLPLPGKDVQYQMAHLNRTIIDLTNEQTKDYKLSAVLVLIYPNEKNEICLLLIERSNYNGHHSKQIALPGGKKEDNDIDLKATAMREFFEETGCDLTPNFIGSLSSICIPISKFIVYPFVASLNKKPNFNIDKREVNELIEWPINELLNPLNKKTTQLEFKKNVVIDAPYFDVNGKVLWGATAMMLNELKFILMQ